jgi:hypothetical protein
MPDLVAGELNKAAGHGIKPSLANSAEPGSDTRICTAEHQFGQQRRHKALSKSGPGAKRIFEGRGAAANAQNYLVYHFDCDASYFWARAYADDIGTVSVYGRFESRK